MSRDEYYINKAGYKQCNTLRSLIIAHDSAAALSFMKKHRINVNSYVRGARGTWTPLIYLLCTERENATLMKYCLTHGVNLKLLPDGEVEYLPYICNSLYLKTLAKLARFKVHHPSILRRVTRGDGIRISQLLQLGLLTDENIAEFIMNEEANEGGIIYNSLKVMLNYLLYVYNMQKGEFNKTKVTEATVDKYRQTIIFLLKHGAKPTQEVWKLCVDYYLFEIIPALNRDSLVDVKYHTQLNMTTVALYRPLLNDYRYEMTCKVLGVIPDPELYQKVK